MLNFVNPPAWSVVEPATSDGANGNGFDGHGEPSGPSVSESLELGKASAINGLFHGVKSDAVLYVPHCAGVSSAAWAPPLKDNLKSLTGNSGMFATFVISCPAAWQVVPSIVSPEFSQSSVFSTSLMFTPSAENAASSFRCGGSDCIT